VRWLWHSSDQRNPQLKPRASNRVVFQVATLALPNEHVCKIYGQLAGSNDVEHCRILQIEIGLESIPRFAARLPGSRNTTLQRNHLLRNDFVHSA
jgi:hypothetical protein